jgi:flavin reductase (DIM6/NTAB) family NADH-FMN oxidoreductase RutF
MSQSTASSLSDLSPDHQSHETHYFYEPARGHGLPHDPFKAIVCPRPIGWISTCDAQGRPNIAPYSFFTAVSDAPPAIAFASDGWKDSALNARATGEFAFNFVTRELAEAMNKSSVMHTGGVDEFVEASIPKRPCRIIKAPCVAASPAVLECKLINIVELNRANGGKTDYKLVIGEVIGVQINNEFLKDGLFDFASTHPVMRAGYRGEYVEITPETLFTMIRPFNSHL